MLLRATVEARTLSSQATLTARLGNLTTVCKIVVTKDEEGPSIKFDVVDEEAGDYRAAREQEGSQQIIKVMGRHPVMKRYRVSRPTLPWRRLTNH